MIFQKIFRSGNTARISLNYTAMRALNAQPGDTLKLNNVRPGVLEVTNPSAEERTNQKRKRK